MHMIIDLRFAVSAMLMHLSCDVQYAPKAPTILTGEFLTIPKDLVVTFPNIRRGKRAFRWLLDTSVPVTSTFLDAILRHAPSSKWLPFICSGTKSPTYFTIIHSLGNE